MSYVLEFELTGLPQSNPADNRHWRVQRRETKQWQRLVKLTSLGSRPKEPLERARAVFTRCSSVEPDSDNLAYSFKRIRDALCVNHGGHVLVDDDPSHLTAVYRWEKAPPKHGKVRVRVEDVSGVEIGPRVPVE